MQVWNEVWRCNVKYQVTKMQWFPISDVIIDRKERNMSKKTEWGSWQTNVDCERWFNGNCYWRRFSYNLKNAYFRKRPHTREISAYTANKIHPNNGNYPGVTPIKYNRYLIIRTWVILITNLGTFFVAHPVYQGIGLVNLIVTALLKYSLKISRNSTCLDSHRFKVALGRHC